MHTDNSLWQLAEITVLNPRLWRDMAIVLGPVFVCTAIFVWYKIRHPEAADKFSEEDM